MMALIALVWLGFQGLAICILGGMLNMGFNPGDAIAIAVVTVTIGAMITRAMYRKTYVKKTAIKAIPHEAIPHEATPHKAKSYPLTQMT